MSVTLAEIEDLFAETIIKVSDMNGMLQTQIATQATMARAHSDVGSAFLLIAQTLRKTEERQDQLEQTNNDLYKEKGIPPNIFFIVAGTLCIVIVLGAIWITDTFVKASLTNIEAGKRQVTDIKSSIDKSAKEIIGEVKDGK